jgi:CheY-like chemotaxis protein
MKGKTCILLVEDNQMAQMLLKLKLEQVGCTVTTAKDGMTGVKLANENVYDLIFMDIGLPDMSGIDATKAIRKSSGPNAKVPIIALTAHSEEDFKDQALAEGMDDFLMKPLNEVAAQAIIKKYVPAK